LFCDRGVGFTVDGPLNADRLDSQITQQIQEFRAVGDDFGDLLTVWFSGCLLIGKCLQCCAYATSFTLYQFATVRGVLR
jgi:hypothetical protein